jgi:hypothetical protein
MERMEKVVKAGWDDTKPVSVLKENELAVLMKTVVDEMEFPEFIVKTIGPFSTEKVFSEYTDAETYYLDLYYDRSHSISKW